MMDIPSRTLPANLATLIREDIMSGSLGPGEPLRQAALADRYDVSRIPVREALLQLESQGLVRFQPHKGALVTDISAEEATELFHMRLLLEPDAISKTVSERDQNYFEAARNLLDQMKSGRPTPEVRKAHHQFHRTLYCATSIPRTVEVLDRLHMLSERYIRLHLMGPGISGRADAEHEGILDKCMAGDAEEAATLSRQHIEKTFSDLQAALAP